MGGFQHANGHPIVTGEYCSGRIRKGGEGTTILIRSTAFSKRPSANDCFCNQFFGSSQLINPAGTKTDRCTENKVTVQTLSHRRIPAIFLKWEFKLALYLTATTAFYLTLEFSNAIRYFIIYNSIFSKYIYISNKYKPNGNKNYVIILCLN